MFEVVLEFNIQAKGVRFGGRVSTEVYALSQGIAIQGVHFRIVASVVRNGEEVLATQVKVDAFDQRFFDR